MSTQKNEQYHILSPEWLKTNPLPEDAEFRSKGVREANWNPSNYRRQIQSEKLIALYEYRTQRADLPPEAYITPPTDTTGSGREGETPETDRQVSITNQGVGHVSIVSADFARQLERQRDAAIAQVEALRRDGERLDWLEKQGKIGSWIAMYEDRGGPESSKSWTVDEPDAPGYDGSGLTLRAAIDSAQRQEKP